MKILFALAGLHRFDRGAEIAFLAVARELCALGHEVTLIGCGPDRGSTPYRYIKANAVDRTRFEGWPSLPTLRNETGWEELTFALSLLRVYRPQEYDVVVTCSYPFTHWILRRPVLSAKRPAQIFVTQNGDWPAFSDRSEFRLFDCDGLVCINPDYFERNVRRFRSALIPNGVDRERFGPTKGNREALGFPTDAKIVLMVSALISSKNVEQGIRAVAKVPDAMLVVAGDGPLRVHIDQLAGQLLGGRYRRLTLSPDLMPELYSSADAFLHLSRDESFGNVFVEAMASGLPVIAYDLPRTRWIVGDGGYWAVGEQDLPSSIASALMAGPAVSELMRDRSEEFAWDQIARQYDSFFREVVESCRNGLGNERVVQR